MSSHLADDSRVKASSGIFWYMHKCLRTMRKYYGIRVADSVSTGKQPGGRKAASTKLGSDVFEQTLILGQKLDENNVFRKYRSRITRRLELKFQTLS